MYIETENLIIRDFELQDVDEMIATVKTENKISCKTVEKCGVSKIDTKMYHIFSKYAK